MATPDTSGLHVLGVRHHGPGSARAVRAALTEIEPDAVLIEGPPEADALTELVGELEPPVALLAYRTDTAAKKDPARSSYSWWPFASFSPEWVALRHAVDRGIPVRFFDLPAAHTLAERAAGDEEADKEEQEGKDGREAEPEAHADPLGLLARAAGHDDTERWWDDVIEQRGDGEPSPFPAIAEAMAAVRAEVDLDSDREARREAHMRQVVRAALRRGHERVAVVCGAWHAPALRDVAQYTVKADTALLKGLPKVKVTATWVPWTHGRLATAGGYGAGVTSPGWYHHLFTAPDRPVHRWLTAAARTLREDEGQAVSTSHVIEGVRLAESLAALRGRPLAGLSEVSEALTSVLCEGEPNRASLVHNRMAIGERMGSVPESTPMVPLQRDLVAAQKRLRLVPEPFDRDLDLDLRKDSQRARSVLLRRLRLLDVEWGVPRTSESGNRGTFRESWRLRWQPEMDVALIESARWGTTVENAAGTRAVALAGEADLGGLTALTEQCLLAALGEALPKVLTLLTDRAATASDITQLMEALPPLARSGRYGDVRDIDAARLRTVAEQILRRICVGLGPAAHGLDDDAATRFTTLIDHTHHAVSLLGGESAKAWNRTLHELAPRESLPGGISGRLNRILTDSGELTAEELRRRLGLAMSPGTETTRAAAWLEGFLRGSGLILVHDDLLLDLIDTWLLGLPEERFTTALPLLRRTFSDFAPAERREIGRSVSRTTSKRGDPRQDRVDTDRAAPALATAATLLTLGRSHA